MQLFCGRFILMYGACISMALGWVPSQAVNAQALTAENYDNVLQIDSQPLKNYLKYPKSGLGNFYKVDVKTADLAGKSSSPYEGLYACSKLGDRPGLLGCRRYAALGLKKKRVAIEVKFSDKAPADEEVSAIACAVPPLVVDLLINDNFAGCVYVPAASFDIFKQALSNQGFQPASQVNTANTFLVTIQLQSEPPARSEGMFYHPSLKK